MMAIKEEKYGPVLLNQRLFPADSEYPVRWLLSGTGLLGDLGVSVMMDTQPDELLAA